MTDKELLQADHEEPKQHGACRVRRGPPRLGRGRDGLLQ